MKPGEEPHVVSDVKSFQPSTLACLEEQPSGSFAGVSKDGNFCWVVRGALLEVVDIATSKRVTAWQFGQVLSDEHTNITCVEEFSVGQTLKLLVGVCNASPTGLLCVFDVSLSKVTKAVEIPHSVTEVELVSTATKNLVPRWALSEHLSYFCGLVAVGTNAGKVFLVDMCTDDNEFFSDEEVPSRLHFISPRIRDIENQRFHCMSQGLHLAIALNENMITRNGFEYQKPDGLVMKTFRTDTVTVSCLKYIQQAGILVVGFSFGCYQLWKLNVPVLEYSSRLEPEPMPVTHIAYQEPENDPKNFCYIWVARGQKEGEDQGLDSVSCISMYQLAFNNKTFYSSYGVFYDELTSVCLRLDHELTSGLVQFGSNYDGGSRVVSCYTLADPRYKAPTKLDENESFEESNHGPDLGLCVFVWEATEGSLSSKVGRHLAIFDINRWYHAQMPSTIRYVSGSTDTCAYFCSCQLNGAAEKAGNDSLLAIHVQADRLRKFTNNSPVPPDQYFYPAALAFNASLVFETGIVNAQFLGSQRQVLASLESNGASSLIQPLDLFNLCIHVGLLPRPLDVTASSVANLSAKREALLGLALEYNMINFLKTCITSWSTGEYEHHGCTLKFLLDWAWDMVSNTKHKIDSTCVILYNWSGLNLDQRSLNTLILCNQRLAHLVSIFKTFLTHTGPITEQGEAEIQSKVLVTSLLCQHLSVVLWFVGAGLLPEADDTEVTLGGLYSYPATSLMTAYKNRRTELQNIHIDIGETDMLMIDGLVETMGVQDLWEREGGSGLYPPPSLHALLSTYLLENCDMLSKHCLIIYLLLDLVSVDSSEDNESFSEKVSGFAQRFNLPPTLVKLMQAFWLLDHRDFEEALNLMLDPMVKAEFSRWQHKRIIKALLYQGDAKMALRYINSVSPALTTPEEVKIKLTVLLANGLTAEALEYQRVCRDKKNINDLLSHLFLGCQQTKTVDRLLQLPLTNEEETILVEYLLQSTEPHSQELLVMHYLQRARFVEAIHLNEKLKHSVLMEANPKARERAAARNAIVDSYANILPHVQRRLMFEQIHVPKKNIQWRREVRRPTPLSTNVTKNKARVMSQSAFIMTIMEKLDEIETDEPKTEVLDKSVGPFICTPVTPARRSQRDTPATVYPESGGDRSAGAGLQPNRSLTVFNFTESPVTAANRSSRFFSASCLSLLQTPSVKRVTPKKNRLSTASNAITPQSILKVRHMIATTSPSPHSGSTTPNSQELEGSSRKLPRKLGYGTGSTPLSSIPRHLAGDRSQTSSQANSPKSVSFVEPVSPGSQPVITPRLNRSSQPATPKSVSFVDRSIQSASKLQPLSTPKQLRFETSRLQGSSLASPTVSPPGDSPRSVHDRSPTPESSEKSPKFAGELDHLQRRPLHTPTKGSPVSEGDNSRLTEDHEEENISDEEVEEMEESSTSGVSVSGSADASISSTGTVQEQAPRRDSQNSPSPEKKSPLKQPVSPTVKISKSPISVFTSDRKEFSEHAQSEVTSTEHAQSVSPLENKKTGLQKDHIDLTEDDEMEVDQSEKDAGEFDEIDVKKSTEIFEEYEEVNAPPEIEEMETAPSNTVETSLNQSIKQEVEEEQFTGPPEPVRQLETPEAPSDGDLKRSPLQRKSLTPPSQRNIPLAKTKDSPPLSSYDDPSSLVRTDGPSSNVDSIINEINDKFADSPVVEETEVKFRAKLESDCEKIAETKTRSRRKFDISPVKVERSEQYTTTPTRRTRQHDTELSAPSETKLTPTRSSRKSKTVESEQEVSTESLTPSRLTRRHNNQEVLESVEQEEAVLTPSRSSRRHTKKEAVTPTRETKPDEPVTPSRSTRRKAKSEVKKEEKIVTISAMSPTSFSPSAKEAVQESLMQISKELKERTESPEGQMTKIKDKTPTSPSRTPTRSRKGAKQELTPTRMSTRLTGKSDHNTDNDENVPVTPTRSGRGRAARTPKRGQKKTDDVETLQEQDKNDNRSVSPAQDDKEVIQNAQIKRTPRRGRKKMDENSIIEVIPNTEPKTPPRKSRVQDVIDDAVDIKEDSFGKSEIPTDYEDIENLENSPATPSRRQTLSRSCKKSAIVSDTEKTPTRRRSFGREGGARTPTRRQTISHGGEIMKVIQPEGVRTRRQSLSRDPIIEETFDVKTDTHSAGNSKPDEAGVEKTEEPETEKSLQRTPSRRGRSKKTEENADGAKVKTPSRRGGRKKAQSDVESGGVESQAEHEANEALSKSKKAKKDDVEEGSPAAHTRSHDTKQGNTTKTAPEMFDIQSASYQFSDPMQVDSADSEVPKPFTPVKSFIFSPPISHTRSVIAEEKEKVDSGILLPPGPDSRQATKEGATKPEKKTKKKTKRLYKEHDEIMLISPVTQGEGDSGEEGRSIITRSTRAAAKKVQTKKDGTKLLVQSIAGIGRKTRTSHRFGPVGQKKS